MNIREANVADIPQLVALNEDIQRGHAEAMPEKFRLDPPAQEVAEAFQESIETPSSFWLVAEAEGEILAFLKSELREREQSWCVIPHRSCYLAGIVVNPTHRRQGIGQQLVEELQREAKSRDMHQIELDVYGFNPDAKLMYESLGFQSVAERMKLSLGED